MSGYFFEFKPARRAHLSACAPSFAGAELPELPEFDMGTLLTVLGGMLGIGGLRTYEKQKGLTK